MAAEWANVVASLVLTIAGVAAAIVVHDTHARVQARLTRTEHRAQSFGFFAEPQD
jgi:hypothetical protein